jgi:hypothetical protein
VAVVDVDFGVQASTADGAEPTTLAASTSPSFSDNFQYGFLFGSASNLEIRIDTEVNGNALSLPCQLKEEVTARMLKICNNAGLEDVTPKVTFVHFIYFLLVMF